MWTSLSIIASTVGQAILPDFFPALELATAGYAGDVSEEYTVSDFINSEWEYEQNVLTLLQD